VAFRLSAEDGLGKRPQVNLKGKFRVGPTSLVTLKSIWCWLGDYAIDGGEAAAGAFATFSLSRRRVRTDTSPVF